MTGCASLGADAVYWERVGNRAIYQDAGTAESAAYRMHTFQRVVDEDARALIDDLDYLTLRDRPSRLSRWHNR